MPSFVTGFARRAQWAPSTTFVIRDGPGGSGIDRCVPAMSTETEHSAINRVRESLVAAVNRSDAAAASQLWTADSRMMPPNQPTLQGRIAIHAHFARLFTQLRFQYTLSNCELQVFGTMAVERIEYHVITHSIADGSATEDRGKGLHVYRRDADGQWRIFADIWNSDRGPESRQA